jgi:hypothetical protein
MSKYRRYSVMKVTAVDRWAIREFKYELKLIEKVSEGLYDRITGCIEGMSDLDVE